MQNTRKQRVGDGSAFNRKGNVPNRNNKDRAGDQNGPPTKRGGEKKAADTKQKRSAFGDLTNATLNVVNETEKKTTKKFVVKDTKKGLVAPKTYNTAVSKLGVRRSRVSTQKKVGNNEEDEEMLVASSQESVPSSQGSDKSEDLTVIGSEEELMDTDSDVDTRIQVPADVDDVDTENLSDPVQVSLYAYEIFEYYKEREKKFAIKPYMPRQTQLSANMRSILVDWLVEVQENFELNHETLYLAVKLVDMYLERVVIRKEQLQLVGASALFISSKFDERCPPLIEDFLYICDDAYNKKQFIEMEQLMLKTITFDLGIPLSYRFLRRYAKCARATMETLTLARYILELSLMEYNLVHEPDSRIACAALLLAFKMKQSGSWTRTLEYYTGYTESDFFHLVQILNTMVENAPSKQLGTIRSKYSHEVFYEVAKIPAVAFIETYSAH